MNMSGLPLSQFNEVVVSERTNLIELTSNRSVVSALRNITSTVGSATVTVSNSEYNLTTTAAASDSAVMDSAEKGRYKPGYVGQCGIGARYADTPTGDMEVRWGYYDDNEGFFFGQDATGIFVARRTGGTDTKTYQSNWNADTLSSSGENPSGFRLDLSAGNIFHIDYGWYGYLAIYYNVFLQDSDGRTQKITVHRANVTGGPSVKEPNLPIRAEILNGTTATAHTLYIGGRQYSILGRYDPYTRITSERRLGLGSVGETFLPLVAFKRKSAGEETSVKVSGFDIISDADLLVQVRTSPTSLTGASYGTPTDHTAAETSLEVDTSASAISGGEVVWQGLIDAAGAGAGLSGFSARDVIQQDLIGTDPMVICARRVSGTGATVSCVLRMVEEW